MRMWGVNTKILCRQHLLGEHKELHMLVGCLNKGKNIKGFVNDGLVDTSLIIQRHDELVEEMKARGYNHKSPLEPFKAVKMGYIDVEYNILDLTDRCDRCRELYNISNK